MGIYEEEYRKYYSDTKAKLNIKSDRKKFEGKEVLKNEEALKLDLSGDIYPKKNYEETNNKIYNSENINFITEGYEKKNYKVEEILCGTYKGLESYSGLSSYNGVSNYNNYRNFDGYSGRIHYGYDGGKKTNESIKEKNLIDKFMNRFIIKLVLTGVLFLFIIGFKFSPYEETKVIYTNFKSLVNANFEYKEFIEDVKTIDVMKEMNDIKDNIKRKVDEANDFNAESNDENAEDVNMDRFLEEINSEEEIVN